MIRTISTGLGALCLPFRSLEPHQVVVFVAVHYNNFGSSNMRRLINSQHQKMSSDAAGLVIIQLISVDRPFFYFHIF